MKQCILVVEDSAAQRQAICRYLAHCDFDSMAAENGLEAIELAQAHHPKLILMDIDMPELDGLEACRELQRDPLTRHIPIVMLSSSEQKAHRLRALMRGAVAYLTKPVTHGTLCRTLEQFTRKPVTAGQVG